MVNHSYSKEANLNAQKSYANRSSDNGKKQLTIGYVHGNAKNRFNDERRKLKLNKIEMFEFLLNFYIQNRR